MLFWSVFLKTHFKKILAVKNAILAVFGGYYLFECIFKKIYQNNICASIVFKAGPAGQKISNIQLSNSVIIFLNTFFRYSVTDLIRILSPSVHYCQGHIIQDYTAHIISDRQASFVREYSLFSPIIDLHKRPIVLLLRLTIETHLEWRTKSMRFFRKVPPPPKCL